MNLKIIIPLSAFTICALAQTAHSIDISATGNEDPLMRVCIEGENAEHKDYALSEQIDACTTLIEEKGDGWTAALLSRAQHYYDSKRHKEALEDYDTLATLMPTNPSVWHGRAKSSVRWFGPNQDAIENMTQAILLTEDTPRSKYFVYRAQIALLVASNDGEWNSTNVERIRDDIERAEALDRNGASQLSKRNLQQLQNLKAFVDRLIVE